MPSQSFVVPPDAPVRMAENHGGEDLHPFVKRVKRAIEPVRVGSNFGSSSGMSGDGSGGGATGQGGSVSPGGGNSSDGS